MLQAYKYHIPFSDRLETSSRSYSHRRGLILELSALGHTYFAEAAPLPGFSSESVDDVLHQISQHYSQIQSALDQQHPTEKLDQLYQEVSIFPSLAFALDTLACELENHQQRQPLPDYLFDDYEPEIPVNALGTLSDPEVIQKVKTATDQGFKTIKLKIGTDFELEYQALQRIRSSFPSLNIRLDANRAWQFKKAVKNCRKLEPLDIEYCEEPLVEVTVDNFKALSQKTTLPLAIDESVTSISNWQKLLPATSFVILKPMIIGHFSTIFDIYKQTRYHHNELIFTSSLELFIGRMMTAILATGLGARKHAHGLATGKLLADDLFSNSYTNDGVFSVPKDGPLMDIEPEKLKTFKTYNFNNGK